MAKPKSLIINSPYVCPRSIGFRGAGGQLEIKPERRPAGYEIFDIRNNTRRTEPLDARQRDPRARR